MFGLLMEVGICTTGFRGGHIPGSLSLMSKYEHLPVLSLPSPLVEKDDVTSLNN